MENMWRTGEILVQNVKTPFDCLIECIEGYTASSDVSNPQPPKYTRLLAPKYIHWLAPKYNHLLAETSDSDSEIEESLHVIQRAAPNGSNCLRCLI